MKDIEIPRFVKWAGGKHQLLKQFKPFFPKKFNRYFEPFVGSGAVAFYVIQKFSPSEVLLSDINEELINAFNIIKTDVENLIIALKHHKAQHMLDAKKHYYDIRRLDPAELSQLEQAARFIYLNRTCFNGLYRVNSKGKFNVPIGSYKNPDIVQEEKLRRISKLLQNVEIKVMSFDKILGLARERDFIYFDPPYYPSKKGNNFTTYTKDNFLEKEQMKLAEVFRELSKKGCLCMESNSDTELIRSLYSDFNIDVVKAKRLINCDASGRGEIDELVVTNYPVHSRMIYTEEGIEHVAFKEFLLSNGTIIGVFQGSRGEKPELDIIIKYQQPGKRVRTPKHIHWVIDVLIKKQHNKNLTLKFVKYLRDMWDEVEPFSTKEDQHKCELKQTIKEKLNEYEALNNYGEYTVEFIGHLIELMMRMEKTGLERAYVFKELMDSIIQEADIFTIVSKATQTGR